MSLAMVVKVPDIPALRTIMLTPSQLKVNQFSVSIYGEPAAEIDDLLPSIRDQGILVPLVVVSEPDQNHFEVISGHRRLAWRSSPWPRQTTLRGSAAPRLRDTPTCGSPL